MGCAVRRGSLGRPPGGGEVESQRTRIHQAKEKVKAEKSIAVEV